jgi:hypothetical protein
LGGDFLAYSQFRERQIVIKQASSSRYFAPVRAIGFNDVAAEQAGMLRWFSPPKMTMIVSVARRAQALPQPLAHDTVTDAGRYPQLEDRPSSRPCEGRSRLPTSQPLEDHPIGPASPDRQKMGRNIDSHSPDFSR